MNVPDKLKYTKEHEWVKIEGKQATMGITDHAQTALGDITFIDLPKIGAVCTQFKQIATVESVKAASDIYAPLSGKVIKVNEQLNANPAIVNQSAYEQGWLCVIELKDAGEAGQLMDAAAYTAHVKQCAH